MTAQPTPVPNGTNIGEIIDGKFIGRSMITDVDGADAMGRAVTAPGVNTALGRLKSISDKQDLLIAAFKAGFKSWFDITPANTNLNVIPDALYIAVAGDLVLQGANNSVATFKVWDGQILQLQPTQVRTETDAEGIIGLLY